MSEELIWTPAWRGAREIAEGRLKAEQWVQALLERVEAREPRIQAWACLDPEKALTWARESDARPPGSPLHGVPCGVKDIIDTAELPTEYGSPIYRGHQPRTDAACLASLRAAGVVPLGKTVTTEFAVLTPGKTRHPEDPNSTPGGSSSGSAAAVAAGMVPLALGTQTAGSILRPASFCGVVGYKPSYGSFSFSGIRHAAEGLDTLGGMARCVRDVDLLRVVLAGGEPVPPDGIQPGVVALCRTAVWDVVEEPMREAVESAARELEQQGVRVVEAELPAVCDELAGAHMVIMLSELARNFTEELARHGDELSPGFRELVETGARMTAADYDRARRLAEQCRKEVDAWFAEFDLVLTAAALGEPPPELTQTGSPAANALWTVLYTPCITLPRFRGTRGLPLGMQFVAPRAADDALLAHARWIEAAWA
jgi:Asp-tRNA(Asn)/Glu-tRNA(Gln) amidotransferase A subunit family amidase